MLRRFFIGNPVFPGAILFFLASMSATIVAVLVSVAVYGDPGSDPMTFMLEHAWPGLAIGMLAEAFVAFFGYRWIVRRVEKRELTEFATASAGRELGIGMLIGSGYIMVVMLILWLLGVYTVAGLSLNTGIIVGLMLGVGAAVAEEIFFRGILLRFLDKKVGPYIAIAIVSVIFGVAHAGNENISLFEVIAIMLEAGLLLNAAYFLTRRLWMVIGIHFAWNFMVGGIFGVSVSGVGSEGGLIVGSLSGPIILTGGASGPEGSIVAVIVGVLIGAAILVIARRRGDLKSASTAKK